MIHVLLPLLLAARVATPTISASPGTSHAGAITLTVSSPATGEATYCAEGSAPRRVTAQRYSGSWSVSSVGDHTINCRSWTLDGRTPSRVATLIVTVTSPEQPPSGLWSATCAAESSPAADLALEQAGKIIYACDCDASNGTPDTGCTAGNNAYNGLSKGSPVKTWDAVAAKFRSLPAGGVVALCKGGRWNGDLNTGGHGSWVNANCTVNSRCTVRDYQATWGGTNKPTIIFTNTSAIELGGYGNSAYGHRFLNLALVMPGSGANARGTGVRGMENYSDLEVCNCTIDGFDMGLQLGDSRNNVMIRGNRILNSCTHGIFGSASNSDIDGNYFDNNGNSAGYPACGYDLANPGTGTNHTIYLSGSAALHPTNLRIINNEVHRNAVYQGYPQGSTFTFASSGENVTYENNLIDMTPVHPTLGGGVFFGGNGYADSIGLNNFVIRRNRILAGRGVQIGYSSFINGLIEDNIIVASVPLGGWSLISVPHDQGTTQATSAVIRNNTIYVTGVAPANAVGIRVASTSATTGNVVTGNSVTFTAGGGGVCFQAVDPAKVAYSANNQCSGGTVGFGSAITPPVSGLFQDPPNDFTPAQGSPLLGAASTATCTVQGSSQPCTSPVAIDSPTWSATSTAKNRSVSGPAPYDIGALER